MSSIVCPGCGVEWIISGQGDFPQCKACGTDLSCFQNNYCQTQAPKISRNKGKIVSTAGGSGPGSSFFQIGRALTKIFSSIF